MAIIYIDPSVSGAGSGTIGDPFRLWASVTWTAGNSYLQKAGTTAVEAIGVGTGGSDEATRITIGSYGSGPAPIVDGRGTTRTFTLGGAPAKSFVTIQDMELIGGDTGANRRCIGAGNTTDPCNSLILRRLLCRDVPTDNSTDCNGIFVEGSDCQIIDCVVRNIADDGIWMRGKRARITGTKVSEVAQSLRVSGDCIQLVGESGSNDASGFYVVGNILDHSDVAVKQGFICSSATSGSGGIFALNRIIGPSPAAGTFSGILCDQPNAMIFGNEITGGSFGVVVQAALKVFGNVINGSSIGIVFDTAGLDSTNAKAWGNTILNTLDYAIYRGSAVAGVAVDNNLMVSCAKGTGLPSGASRTFNNYFNVPGANISDCIGGGCAAETYTQLDPQLDASYKLGNAALRTAGTYLGGGDFYGKAFQSPPSIGAVQYQGAARSLVTRSRVARSVVTRALKSRVGTVP